MTGIGITSIAHFIVVSSRFAPPSGGADVGDVEAAPPVSTPGVGRHRPGRTGTTAGPADVSTTITFAR
ncbi:hypothetical protein GCM10023223_33020 [Stackebrandtia albiflava]